MCPLFHLVSPIANCLENLEHDPEKHALGLDPRVETGFPRDERKALRADHAQTRDEIAYACRALLAAIAYRLRL